MIISILIILFYIIPICIGIHKYILYQIKTIGIININRVFIDIGIWIYIPIWNIIGIILLYLTEFKKKSNEIIWHEILIRCPSQCKCYYEVNGTRYCIYLRWRHSDPWIADIIRIEEGEEKEWEALDVNFYSHDDYKKLEKECINIIKKKYKSKNIKWLRNEKF